MFPRVWPLKRSLAFVALVAGLAGASTCASAQQPSFLPPSSRESSGETTRDRFPLTGFPATEPNTPHHHAKIVYGPNSWYGQQAPTTPPVPPSQPVASQEPGMPAFSEANCNGLGFDRWQEGRGLLWTACRQLDEPRTAGNRDHSAVVDRGRLLPPPSPQRDLAIQPTAHQSVNGAEEKSFSPSAAQSNASNEPGYAVAEGPPAPPTRPVSPPPNEPAVQRESTPPSLADRIRLAEERRSHSTPALTQPSKWDHLYPGREHLSEAPRWNGGTDREVAGSRVGGAILRR